MFFALLHLCKINMKILDHLMLYKYIDYLDFKVKKEVTFVKNLKLQYFKVCIILIMNLKVDV
jgi:hypothetical protein